MNHEANSVSRGNLAHFPQTLVYRKSVWSNFPEILRDNSPMGLYWVLQFFPRYLVYFRQYSKNGKKCARIPHGVISRTCWVISRTCQFNILESRISLVTLLRKLEKLNKLSECVTTLFFTHFDVAREYPNARECPNAREYPNRLKNFFTFFTTECKFF